MFDDKDESDYYGFIEYPVVNSFFKKLCFSRKIPRIVRYPVYLIFSYKLIRMIRYKVKKMKYPDRPICFITHRDHVGMIKKGLYNRIKKCFPGSKVIIVVTDIITPGSLLEKLVNHEEKNQYVDMIYSFNPLEAKKYDLYLCNVPASDFSGGYLSSEIKYDVIFIGKIKDRKDMVIRTWNSFTKRGLRCAFFLNEVNENEKNDFPSGVIFSDWMSYQEYLKKTAESRIILEISQGGSTGNTLRVNEAVILGKKLISDNTALKDNPSYDPGNMFVFDEPDEIPDDFLFGNTKDYSTDIKEKISFHHFFEQIDNDISNKLL
ncbi:MAG: hypothetical protein J5517_00700 [Eubacterium sp.]|nr:hypothetical protein [Eubacterium sp.]